MKVVRVDSVKLFLPDTVLPDEFFYYGRRDIIVPVARKVSDKKLWKLSEFADEVLGKCWYKELSKPVEEKICRILHIDLYEEV